MERFLNKLKTIKDLDELYGFETGAGLTPQPPIYTIQQRQIIANHKLNLQKGNQ